MAGAFGQRKGPKGLECVDLLTMSIMWHYLIITIVVVLKASLTLTLH